MRVALLTSAVAVAISMTACDSSTNMGTTTPSNTPAAEPANPMPAAQPAATLTTNDASLLAEPTWAVLFAGQDLNSFNEIGGGNWRLEDGILVAEDGDPPGFMVTKAAFSDFHIRVEFQASGMTNSGVFIRCANPSVVSAEECYEINIFDENQNANNRTGAVVGLIPPAVSAMAGDAWNTFDIIAEGAHLTVRFNGTVTADGDDPENRHTSGHIGLQFNGGPIRFRDVRIRPL